MELLFNWVWENEYAPSRWRQGVVVDLFEKEDKTEQGNYKGITLLNTVGNVSFKLLNDGMVGVLDEGRISQGQAGFRKKTGTRAGQPTYCFFLDVEEADDTVWRNWLWKQLLSEHAIKGKMWRMLNKLKECTKSAVIPDGELNENSSTSNRGPTSLKGVKVGETWVSGMMFADDFVGVPGTPEGLEPQIDAAKDFTDLWRLSINVKESAVMVAEKGRARAGKLYPILANRHLDTCIKFTVLKSVIVPPLEYAGDE
ncbi:unnamed protein product [Ectocarpus sp. CCAP 1310/34]|nr:unnamed protein product [Ectocarpus sp. CCAP 1310/34]